MTFEGWIESGHFFDFLKYHELQSMPEWDGWVEIIDATLSNMAYEDSIGCDMEDLISLAGLTGEIELALKERMTNERMNEQITGGLLSSQKNEKDRYFFNIHTNERPIILKNLFYMCAMVGIGLKIILPYHTLF